MRAKGDFLNIFRKFLNALPGKGNDSRILPFDDAPLLSPDTRMAIDELSKAVRNNTEAVEIYLALGSLYRFQGEIDRAIQIRNNLIVRPGLEPKFKARALFELGRDFMRSGFLDRARRSFEQAASLGFDKVSLKREQAKLAAELGDFEQAAEMFGDLGLELVQAHYLVRAAQEHFDNDSESAGNRLLKQAFKVYPASVEAALETLILAHASGSLSRLRNEFRRMVKRSEPDMRFILFEGLLSTAMADMRVKAADSDSEIFLDTKLAAMIIEVIDEQEPDVLNHFYAAKALLLANEPAGSRRRLEKVLELSPDFWLARLELFNLCRDEQTFTPFFEEQLDFFVSRAREVRRFVCRECGLKRDYIFFVCPRCRSWHSISFREKFIK